MGEGEGININIQKKHIYFLASLILLLYVIGFVISGTGQGASKNPGHDLDTIQGYNSGDTDLGDTITDLYSNAQKPSITYIASKATRGTTTTIPESVIIEYCADEDGCEMRLGMYSYDSLDRVASRHFLFNYNQNNKEWRSSADSQAKNNNGATQHIYTAWACYFTDAKYTSWTDNGDNDLNFGLLSWNQNTAECRLTISD